MWKKVAIGVVVFLVLAVIGGFLLPADVHVERSLEMKASPAQVYPLVASLESFNRWSPWFKRDPKTKYTFTGKHGTVGSKMAWVSDNPKVGTGSQEITELVPGERVKTHLDFGGDGEGDATFTLTSTATGTKVTWSLDSHLGSNPIARYFGLMFDGMIGPDYEAGLNNLKAIVEGGAPKGASGDTVKSPGAATPTAAAP
ncbi:MAG: SRPBCC family protein [Myxococcales bacterium]|nr:SRPBCC family protein [Myxococcales bacterium]